MKIRVLHFALVIVISLLLGYYIGVNKVSFAWKNFAPNISVANKEPPDFIQNIDFSMFWSVWKRLEYSYYDKQALDPQKLLNGAISGMVASIGDPYTMFLPPSQNENFKDGMAGKFEGIGAELGLLDKQIIIVSPLSGSPAHRSGVRAGDAILKVDDKSTQGWTLAQTVEKIRGPKGTAVVLTLLHKDRTKAVDIKIIRDTINVKSVDGWMKPIKNIEDIGSIKGTSGNEEIVYIQLTQFGDKTNQEWLSLINKLRLDINNNPNIKGIVFDLRNNPGGYLTDAAFISAEFIPSGTVVIQEKGNGERTVYSVTRKGLLLGIPLVVLINKGSASASEIVAGALRDHKRAKLIGETSFGKGTIQQAEDLGNGAGLHVTIAKWLTPNGIWINGKGLTPDIAVELDEKDPSHDTQLEKAIEELVK